MTSNPVSSNAATTAQSASEAPKLLPGSPSQSSTVTAKVPPIKLNLDSPQMKVQHRGGSTSPVTPFNFDPLKSPSLPSQPPFYGHRTPITAVKQQQRSHVGSAQGSLRSPALRSPLAVPTSPTVAESSASEIDCYPEYGRSRSRRRRRPPDVPPFDLPLNSVAGVNHLQARLRSLELASASRAQAPNPTSSAKPLAAEPQNASKSSDGHSRTRSRAGTDPSIPPSPRFSSLRRADRRAKRVIAPKSEKSPVSRRLNFGVPTSGDCETTTAPHSTREVDEQSNRGSARRKSRADSLDVPPSPVTGGGSGRHSKSPSTGGSGSGRRSRASPRIKLAQKSSTGDAPPSSGISQSQSFSVGDGRNRGATEHLHEEVTESGTSATMSTSDRAHHKHQDIKYGNDVVRNEIWKERSSFSQHLGLGFFMSEFTRPLPHPMADETPEERLANFFKVPLKFEQMVFFGVLACVDGFLDLLIMSPLRCLLQFFRWSLWRPTSNSFGPDSLRIILVVLCVLCMNVVDVSQMYHYIRGQSTFKLYVLYGILQVLDQLFCSFGVDIVECLMWQKSIRTAIFYFVPAFIYSVLHSFAFFAQIVTLNAAINSRNDALIGVLVFNNMTELKGFVFKRYSKQNLAKVMSSDIVERFQLGIFLMMIFVQNLSNMHWHVDEVWLRGAATTSLVFVGFEVVVDFVKHGFMTKFNHIRPKVYSEFTEVLCGDIVSSYIPWNEELMRNSFTVDRRLRFSPIPFVCYFIRTMANAFSKSTAIRESKLLLLGCLVVGAVLLKLCIRAILFGHACRRLLKNRRAYDSDDDDDSSELPSTRGRHSAQKKYEHSHSKKDQ